LSRRRSEEAKKRRSGRTRLLCRLLRYAGDDPDGIARLGWDASEG
jgi:hypothetical protein